MPYHHQSKSNNILPSPSHQMTGLNPSTNTILSLSCLLTDAHLNLLDPTGFDTTIHHPESILSAMDPWCTRTHTTSGLVASCLASTTTAECGARDLLTYIRSHIAEPGVALLAGNSIHADRAFLARDPWDRVLRHLHYRMLDVSSIKEAVRRWAPEKVVEEVPRKLLRHEARSDVEESIEEARYYMRLFEQMGEVSGGGAGGGEEEREKEGEYGDSGGVGKEGRS